MIARQSEKERPPKPLARLARLRTQTRAHRHTHKAISSESSTLSDGAQCRQWCRLHFQIMYAHICRRPPADSLPLCLSDRSLADLTPEDWIHLVLAPRVASLHFRRARNIVKVRPLSPLFKPPDDSTQRPPDVIHYTNYTFTCPTCALIGRRPSIWASKLSK